MTSVRRRPSRQDWEERAGRLEPRTQAFIDGGFVPAVSGETFADRSPRDGKLLAEVASCDAVDVAVAVASGRRAFEDGRWRGLAPRQRKRALRAWRT